MKHPMHRTKTALPFLCLLPVFWGLFQERANAQTIVVQTDPQPPVVIVEEQPRPVQPPIVIVQPQEQVAPPPMVIVQPPAPRRPPPRQVFIRRAPQQRRVRVTNGFDVGMRAYFAGHFANDVSMAGFGGAFRLRPVPWMAFDLGIAGYGGTDPQGRTRVEMPIQLDAVFFFNPGSTFQLYSVLGAGISYAAVGSGYSASPAPGYSGYSSSGDRTYAGGELGLGVEWRIARFFALNFDVRGFMRGRIDSSVPEYVSVTSSGVQTTNLSGGVYGTLGATFYFIGDR